MKLSWLMRSYCGGTMLMQSEVDTTATARSVTSNSSCSELARRNTPICT